MNTMIFLKQNCEEIISYLTNWTGKKFLEILTKRDLVFFLNKKKMSGGLNGAALPAYTKTKIQHLVCFLRLSTHW